jgi:serine/threonine protein kinase
LNLSVTFRHPNLPDLKLNILVDNNSHARLAGFSLLTIASDELTAPFSFTEGNATRWKSPELFDPGSFGLRERRPTKESDCYALGMVMYEALSGQWPFAEYENNNIVMRKIIEGIRPRRPQGKEGELFTDDIWDTLELCWKPQPRDRISASTALLRLEKHPPLPMPSSNWVEVCVG